MNRLMEAGESTKAVANRPEPHPGPEYGFLARLWSPSRADIGWGGTGLERGLRRWLSIRGGASRALGNAGRRGDHSPVAKVCDGPLS